MATGLKKQIIPLRGSGPIKAQLEVWDGHLSFFSDSARNTLIRDAIWQGGEYYRTTFVPLKFTNYARKYGYHATQKYVARKRKMFGAEMPLVFTDQQTHAGLRSQVIGGARTEARVTKGVGVVLIRLPGPSYMNAQPMVYKVLRSVLPEEVERVAKIIGRAMEESLGDTVSDTRGRRQLTPAQAATFSRSKTAQRGRKSTQKVA